MKNDQVRDPANSRFRSLFTCRFAVLVSQKDYSREDDKRRNKKHGNSATEPALRLCPGLSGIGFAGGAALRIQRGTADQQYEEQNEFEYTAHRLSELH